MGTSFILFSNPALQLIQTGKGEAIRIRSILRSLVPTEDLVGIISIPLKLPSLNKGKRSSSGLSAASPRWGPLSRGQASGAIPPCSYLQGRQHQGRSYSFSANEFSPLLLAPTGCSLLCFHVRDSCMSHRYGQSRSHSPRNTLTLYKEADGMGPVKALTIAFFLCLHIPHIVQPPGAAIGLEQAPFCHSAIYVPHGHGA